MTERLRLVVFDLDDVLVHFRPPRRLDYLHALTGLAREHLHESIWASDFEPAAEAGAWPDPDDYLDEFNKRIGYRVTVQQWIEARRAAMELRPEVLDVARSLRGRVELALLTNNGSLLKRSLPDLVPDVCEVFAPRVHASCDFNARKPDPIVFTRLLEHYGVSPEQALHIDDSLDYVNGAIAAGLKGVVFHDVHSLIEALGQLLSTDRGK
ncbi:putative hydrolase of the HAD superfamily [Povalibacter uvarum]|uniref:Putative hydrolase of the HAD superfamily n=1 Tax=Povalibacter uvarum TaxID=732238 RepID=A0A841HKM3_9GAMM|nr:HAD family phosphatase [Povalibacter uvarum]MBB6092850.1 putative hydrolase of the HAD superfamily [Povalibacter uvarum]